MQLTTLLLIATLMQVTASSFSQEITLNFKDASIRTVLREIRAQSGFNIYYDGKAIPQNYRTDIVITNATVSDALNQLFEHLPLTFEIEGKMVSIRSKGSVPIPVSAQSLGKVRFECSGRVTDSKGNQLAGVTVHVKGTSLAVTTDSTGHYRINIPMDGSTLVFSLLGFESFEQPINGENIINVVLQETILDLDEVVVVGYGTQKRSDLTGSVATIKGDQIANRGTVNVSQSLQGTTPGLMITRSGGSAADASASIRIRGVTTIGNSNPLIILDGIPIRSLDWINPNDIESISVLKDASSAAIYGSRAAAGVIIVTTKAAKSGQINLAYNHQRTIEQPTRVAEHAGVTDYMRVLNEITWNDNNNLEGTEYPVFPKELIENYHQLHASNPDEYPITDWTDLMLNKMAVSEKHGLSMNAGGERVKSFISLNYDKTNALYDGRNFDRITLKSNNNIAINDHLSLDLNLNALYVLRNRPRLDLTPGPVAGTIYAAAWDDGRIAGGKDGDNPYALLKHGGYNHEKSSVLGGQLKLTYRPINPLKFTAVLSPQLDNTKGKFFRKKVTYTAFDDPLRTEGQIIDASGSALFRETRLDELRADNLSTMVQLFSDYSINAGNHSANITLGFEESYSFSETLGAFRDRYILTEFPYLNNGNENFQFNDGSAYEFALRSFFGRLSYDYRSKYLLQANVRYDGSSRFAKEHRWGWFPSVSAGWTVSEEDFIESVNSINFLKVRASWGSLGNERIGNYPYQSTLGFGSVPVYRGNEVVSLQTVGLADYAIRDISWETTEVSNLGIDARFLQDRLTLTADYFVKRTRDMLLALEIPNFMGVSNPQQNAGQMRTKGWEIAVGWNGRVGGVYYSVNGHLSDAKSVMGDLGGTEFLGDRVKFKGSEFDEWYGYKSDGLFQTIEEVEHSAVLNSSVKPGDIKYLDISGPDGVPDGRISPEYDRVLLGGGLPRLLYGGNLTLNYHNFDFGVVFQGIGRQNTVINNEMVQPIRSIRPSLEIAGNVIDNYWSQYNSAEKNLTVQYPRVGTIARNNNNVHSDFWMFNGGYFRLKNLTVGYNIPGQWLSSVGVKNIRLNLTGTDLFSIDRFPKGWDPETTSTYWVTRAYVLGISVQF